MWEHQVRSGSATTSTELISASRRIQQIVRIGQPDPQGPAVLLLSGCVSHVGAASHDFALTFSSEHPIFRGGPPLPNEGQLIWKDHRHDLCVRDACVAAWHKSRPAPHFSSGPCAKRPGWSVGALDGALVGRSHRSKEGKARLKQAIDLTREVLEIPADYRIGILPASDTGAFEAAMWSMLGERGIDVAAWESFGKGWAQDILKELKLTDVRAIDADYGAAAGPRESRFFARRRLHLERHHVGRARRPTAIGSPPTAPGLTLCDATSAAFAQELPWSKLDVTTYSWQKALGGEAQHGMHRAVAAGGRTAEDLPAEMAAAENLPARQGRQADRRHLRGRDHRHPVDAGG